MANEEHLKLIKQGVDVWNKWSNEDEHRMRPDLYHADLYHADLRDVNLRRADLYQANLRETDLRDVDLSGADLSEAEITWADLRKAKLMGASALRVKFLGTDLRGANLSKAQLSGSDFLAAKLIGANLSGADLSDANLSDVDLRRADLRGANLTRANFVGTNLKNADLTGCRIYGISAWDVRVNQGTKQSDLIITQKDKDESPITVDNLEIAQFIYLLLNNQKIRHVIDTVTSKVVLILGRFTEERKRVLDAIREELRKHDYIPVLFDFDKPKRKDITGTVETLARMARFIIADLTDPSSLPHELGTIVPSLRTTPVLPIKLVGSKAYSMFEDYQRSYKWVLKVYEYSDGDTLISNLQKVIAPADKMADKLQGARNRKAFRTQSSPNRANRDSLSGM